MALFYALHTMAASYKDSQARINIIIQIAVLMY